MLNIDVSKVCKSIINYVALAPDRIYCYRETAISYYRWLKEIGFLVTRPTELVAVTSRI